MNRGYSNYYPRVSVSQGAISKYRQILLLFEVIMISEPSFYVGPKDCLIVAV